MGAGAGEGGSSGYLTVGVAEVFLEKDANVTHAYVQVRGREGRGPEGVRVSGSTWEGGGRRRQGAEPHNAHMVTIGPTESSASGSRANRAKQRWRSPRGGGANGLGTGTTERAEPGAFDGWQARGIAQHGPMLHGPGAKSPSWLKPTKAPPQPFRVPLSARLAVRST